MKKKILIFSVVSLICTCAFGQYTTVVTDDASPYSSTNPVNGIVRNWTGTDYCVTYSYGDGGVFRAMKHNDYTSGAVTLSFPVYEVAIPSILTDIVDFRIIGEYVCFCGFQVVPATPPYSIHYFGFFKIGELLYDTAVHYKIMRVYDGTVEKIEGFCDSHGFNVYALGYHWTSLGNHSAIYEISDPTTATHYRCFYATNSLQMPDHEVFDDLVVLDDRVVVVASHILNIPTPIPTTYGPIEMRYMSKTLGFSDPQLNTRYYQTASVPSPNHMVNSRIKAKPISGDSFVLGYTYSTLPSGGSTRRTRVFDINLDNTVSQEYSIYDKLELKEMIYNSVSKTLTILEPDALTTRFVFLHPEQTVTYTALTLFDPGYKHVSLDTISTTQFVATKERNWLFQYADQLSYNPSAPSNSCINNGTEKVGILPPLTKFSYPNMLNYVNGGAINSPSSSVVYYTIPRFCVSY